MTARRSPAVPLAVTLALALALAACERPGARGAAGARTGTASLSPPREDAPEPGAADTVALYPAAELARIAGQLGNGATGRTLGATPAYSYIQGRRTASGAPELHRRWTDIALVQAGHATLQSGGRIVGGRESSPGEERGGSLVGGTARPLAPGDVVVIPAGIPHQYRLSTGETLTYLTITVRPGR